MVARFMLTASPILMDVVGQSIHGCIGGIVRQCDAFGDYLIGTSLRCGGWDFVHKKIEQILFLIAQDSGAVVQSEPSDFFLSCVPEQRRGEYHNRKHNVCPDLQAKFFHTPNAMTKSERIYDVKSLNSFDYHYKQPARHSAVNACDRDTKSDYLKRIRKLDVSYNLAQGAPGPFEQRYNAFDGIQTLCFGVFSEVNDSVINFLKSCSFTKARAMTDRYMNDRSPLLRSDSYVNMLSNRFFNTYLRATSSFVGFLKAELLISRKDLIGLTPDQQRPKHSDGFLKSKIFSGFMRDHYESEKGSHFHDTMTMAANTTSASKLHPARGC